MPLAREAGAAVEQDRGDAAQQPALLHAGQVLEQLVLRHADRVGGVGVRLRHDRHVALQRADDGDVEVVVGLRLGLGRLLGDGGAGQRVGVADHLQVHPDLEQLERRQHAHRLGAGLLGQDVERALQPELRVGLGGDREPQVELVVAQVVVRHARVRVDDLRGPVRVVGVDLGRDQHRLVAERARVEDRRDLADDAVVDQLLHALRGPRPRATPSASATRR